MNIFSRIEGRRKKARRTVKQVAEAIERYTDSGKSAGRFIETIANNTVLIFH
jgi:hypothetical protein